VPQCFSGGALEEFQAELDRGHLPAVVPYVDVRSNIAGLAAAGIPMAPDGTITELARSDDLDDRAAAAIMVCTNVARATERLDDQHKCPQLAAPLRRTRTPMRVSHANRVMMAAGPNLGFLRHTPTP
jgi:hypothetical protein